MNPKVKKARERVKTEVAQELRRIYGEHSALKPSVVVAEAQPDDSPLHGEFEWNDEKAGHEFRLYQARHLIRVVAPIIKAEDGTEKRDPFVWVPPRASEAKDAETREGAYHPISVVIKDSDAYARALSALSSKVTAAVAAAEELRSAAESSANPDSDRLARIGLAIAALQTAGEAVKSLH